MLSFEKVFLLVIASFIVSATSTLNFNKRDHQLPVIEITGNKFFSSKTNEQFFIKGIAYQPGANLGTLEDLELLNGEKFIDPLADEVTCQRDIPLLAELGVNVIRVYQINVNKNHDFCMDLLAENGIYVLADLSEPDLSIPREAPNFTTEIFKRYIDVVNVMSQYTNTLGYFAGNEVTNDKSTTLAAAFVKASVRDIKNYMKEAVKKGTIPRTVPVGYSTNDDPDIRLELMDYFICDSEKSEIIDFYGVNIYEWCGHSSYVSSGYRDRTKEHKDFPIPLFMSEFGCNLYRPRPFTEIEAIYSPLMTDVWSGGLVYMFFEEENHYGVVERISPTKVKILPEFDNLKNQYNKVQPKGISKEAYQKTLKTKVKKNVECPAISENWKADSGNLPPTPDFNKCKCLESLPCSIQQSLPTVEMYRQLFDTLCNIVDCADIEYKDGVYGQYSDCSKTEQLSYVMSKVFYYQKRADDCPLSDLLSEFTYFNPKFSSINKPIGSDACSEIAVDVKQVATNGKHEDRNPQSAFHKPNHMGKNHNIDDKFAKLNMKKNVKNTPQKNVANRNKPGTVLVVFLVSAAFGAACLF